MGRSKEFEETAVLHKAMELFWRQGYEKTSMNDLISQMGIHRKSLYDTFGDKHTLFLKAIDRYREQIGAHFIAMTTNAETALEAIQAVFDYAIETRSKPVQGCLLVNSATELGLRDPDVEAEIEDAFSKTEMLLASLLLNGQKTGEFSQNIDVQLTAETLHNTLLGLRVLARVSAPEEKMRRIADSALLVLKQ